MASVILTSPAQADSPERVFEKAEAYTVRIKTRIEKALGDDKAGVFSGTGFIVDAERGWIVSNRHVVGESPSHVQVSLKGTPYQDADKVYVDTYTDIAVLQADLDGARSAKLECDDVPGTGHPVGAYGHPWGLEYTGTQGVVSGRTHDFGTDLLQTDAPINSGNSGGPLISMRSGKVVGIGTSSYNNNKAENTNFAVPIVEVCKILDLLADHRDPLPPQLDVAFYDFRDTDELVVARSYLDPKLLSLQPRDRIISVGINSLPVNKHHELINALRGKLDHVILNVERNSNVITIEGRLNPQRVRTGVVFAGMVLGRLGIRDASTLPTGHDIMIQDFVDGAPSQAVGLKTWDVIVSVNGDTISSLSHVFDALSLTSPGDVVTVEFIRFLGDSQHFQYVQREIVADDPEWLSEDGFWGGVRAQLNWKRDFIVDNPSLNREDRARHRDSINDLLSSIDDRQDEVPRTLLSEIRQMADDLLLALNRPAPEVVSDHP
jgi:S1-C subfamily serine protease